MLQYTWLILLYYLMMNSFYILTYEKLSNLNITLKSNLAFYNDLIMSKLIDYNSTVLYLSLLFFVSGTSIAIVLFMSILDYRIAAFVTIGIELGYWLFVMFLTYKTYEVIGVFFPIAVLLISLAVRFLKDAFSSYFSHLIR